MPTALLMIRSGTVCSAPLMDTPGIMLSSAVESLLYTGSSLAQSVVAGSSALMAGGVTTVIPDIMTRITLLFADSKCRGHKHTPALCSADSVSDLPAALVVSEPSAAETLNLNC